MTDDLIKTSIKSRISSLRNGLHLALLPDVTIHSHRRGDHSLRILSTSLPMFHFIPSVPMVNSLRSPHDPSHWLLWSDLLPEFLDSSQQIFPSIISSALDSRRFPVAYPINTADLLSIVAGASLIRFLLHSRLLNCP